MTWHHRMKDRIYSCRRKHCKCVKYMTLTLIMFACVINLGILLMSKSVPLNDVDRYSRTVVQTKHRRDIYLTEARVHLPAGVNFTKPMEKASNEISKTDTRLLNHGDESQRLHQSYNNQSTYIRVEEKLSVGNFPGLKNNTKDVFQIKMTKSPMKSNLKTQRPEVLKATNRHGLQQVTPLNFIEQVEARHAQLKVNQSAFGNSYRLSKQRRQTYDFSYIIDGRGICRNVDPFLVILVLSVHTHIDTRETIRQTWGRAAKPGVWPKLGNLTEKVILVFLLGRGNDAIKNKIIEYENVTYGDVVQADFKDTYFNLTRKVIMGIRWVAEFCPGAKYMLKADEDVFVHVPNLIHMLKGETLLESGAVYGHLNQRSDVLRTGKWAVSNKTYPLDKYPPYVSGNTYVISGNLATRMFYVAGHLPYMNIEDVFVCGILRTMIGGTIIDALGFTHWYENKPRPCEFKNSHRISATKTDDMLKMYIWEELKTNLTDCYKVMKRNTSSLPVKRPENHFQSRPSFRQSIRDEHVFFNKTSRLYYVV